MVVCGYDRNPRLQDWKEAEHQLVWPPLCCLNPGNISPTTDDPASIETSSLKASSLHTDRIPFRTAVSTGKSLLPCTCRTGWGALVWVLVSPVWPHPDISYPLPCNCSLAPQAPPPTSPWGQACVPWQSTLGIERRTLIRVPETICWTAEWVNAVHGSASLWSPDKPEERANDSRLNNTQQICAFSSWCRHFPSL